MAAPFFSTPFQPYVYQSQQDAVTPFQILGGEAQIVQIMLKPQEKVIAKPGSMCFMSGSIEMENTYVPENEAGMWQWLFGKSVTSIALRNNGPNDGFVGIAAPSLARVLPIDLAMFGGVILCQPDAFLCSINDVKVNNTVDQRPRNIVTSVEGFLRQKLSGQGLAFILAGGSVVQKILEVGEVLAVDISCIVALTTSIDVQIKYNGPIRRAVFGFFRCNLAGGQCGYSCSNRTRNCIHPKFAVSSIFTANRQGGYISQHERKPKVLRSDSHFLFSSLCGDCIFLNIDRCVRLSFPF
ncbi:uncharacterized protein LOC120186988 isoform X1 [Hibiscus syriacus]|uniref:uncharacterized protein LOC120186988 isoform X1 n=1 Tax=Hibiscus syriacus TaxID=106335 RepID=UPI001920F8B7|nr:uncharacterized protein LOC120186988 isoform X1 [Hibiscus syriacus]